MKKSVKIIISVVAALVIAGCVAFGDLYNIGMSGLFLKGEPASENQIKVACVGDSVTYGHGIKNWKQNNYPAVLARLLGSNYNVRNFGDSGRTVGDDTDQPYVLSKQYTPAIEYDADIVVFMMGSNDSKEGNWYGEEQFRKDATALIGTFAENGKKPRVLICTPPEAFYKSENNSGFTSFGICPERVDIIADIIREIAEENGLEIIDIHAITQDHPELFCADSVHPNNAGAEAIADAVYRAITQQ